MDHATIEIVDTQVTILGMQDQSETKAPYDCYWDDDVTFNPKVTMVFKGGGIRGLFFPGAFRGLIQKGAFRIGAFAGASAGAMIATILWCGLRPKQLIDHLKEDSSPFFGLTFKLFSIQDIATILFKSLLMLFCVPANILLSFVYPLISHVPRLIGSEPWEFRRHYININIYCRGDRFRRFVNRYLLLGLQERGFNRELIEDYFGCSFDEFEPTFRDLQELVAYVRDVSQVGRDDEFGQSLLKDSFGEKFELMQKGMRYTDNMFGGQSNNVLELMFDTSIRDAYFPPLFISVSCIDTARGVIIDNLDPQFGDLKICDVIRASAGHPFFFEPKWLTIGGESRLYTDGGVFNNLPATAASRAFTKRIKQRQIDIMTTDDKVLLPFLNEYDAIATSPLITVGIGTEDIVEPKFTTDKIRKMASGMGKDQIELELSRTVGGFSYILHRTPRRPSYLNFFAATPAYISKISKQTENTILREKNIRFNSQLSGQLADDTKALLAQMAEIVMSPNWVGADHEDAFVRVHLFFEDGVRQRKLDKKCVLTFNRPNGDFNDIEISIVRENCGILGVSRNYADPVFCRINALQDLRRQNPDGYYLGLKYDEISSVPEGMNFCFALPVFEYRGVSYGAGRMQVEPVPGFEKLLLRFDTGINGPISALVSIDGFLPGFDCNIDEIERNIMISRVVGSLERHCLELSIMLHAEVTSMVPSRTLDA